jgi:transcription-repair coupling factor (superfamily II helicase)
MLAEEINKRKSEWEGGGADPVQPVNTQLDLGVDAYLPPDYIYDSIQKIEIYKKVAAATSLDDVSDLFDELTDRFGDPPKAVLNLLTVARLKVYGRLYGIESIQHRGDETVIKFEDRRAKEVEAPRLKAMEAKYQGRMQAAVAPEQLVVKLKTKGLDEDGRLALIEAFLVQYKEVLKSKGELQDVAP